MAVIRLYRKFYRISSAINVDSYTLINPTSISANSYLTNGSSPIEANTVVTKESDGVYYVDLNPIYYSYDYTYDLKWAVQYTSDAPPKMLTTTFKLNPINIVAGGGEIYTEIENQLIEVIVL